MPIVDISSAIDSESWEPELVEHRIMSAREGAVHMTSGMTKNFGITLDPSDLPGGEFLTNDIVTLTSHTGTHVDAPAHYGPPARGSARTIDQMPLEWFHNPGFVLDISDVGTGVADAARLEKALADIGYDPQPLDIALLHTAASAWAGSKRYFTDFTGLDGSATRFLLDLGVRVIGTDAFSLDAPFGDIITRYAATGDRRVLWPAHFLGREIEYCQIERLAALDTLPPHGFTVSCFPVKLARGGAGWARAVAHVG